MMSFAMLCGPDGGLIILGLLLLAGATVLVSACIGGAIFATIQLAKWAAARHNRRLAASLR